MRKHVTYFTVYHVRPCDGQVLVFFFLDAENAKRAAEESGFFGFRKHTILKESFADMISKWSAYKDVSEMFEDYSDELFDEAVGCRRINEKLCWNPELYY